MISVEDLLSGSPLGEKELVQLASIAAGKPIPRQATREHAIRRLAKELANRTSEEFAANNIGIIVSKAPEIAEGEIHGAISEWDEMQSANNADDDATRKSPKENTMEVDVQENVQENQSQGRRQTRRKSIWSNKQLFPTAKNSDGELVNPRRAGTHGHRSYQILLDNPGISGDEYIARGGRWNDLKWDIDHGWVDVAGGDEPQSAQDQSDQSDPAGQQGQGQSNRATPNQQGFEGGGEGSGNGPTYN